MFREHSIFVNMGEPEIIRTALENLEEKTGIKGHWEELRQNNDAKLCFSIDESPHAFTAEVKKEVRQHHIQHIQKQNEVVKDLIVVAERLLPATKAELRELLIPYLEANGNFFLKKNGTWVWIDTNPPIKIARETGNRAFTKTGLKVIFHFLLDQSKINDPQRLIAQETRVGLGSIPQIIEGLKKIGYIYQLNKDSYGWTGRTKLLERWITEYETVLKPSLSLGQYTFKGDHGEIRFKEDQSVWGGELAADFLTRHLRPADYTIYTKETKQELMENYRLIPKNDGEISVFKWFWHSNLTGQKIAPPLLVYADLMIKGDKRSRETAQIIFDEYLVNSI